jgi:hypothetical protein
MMLTRLQHGLQLRNNSNFIKIFTYAAALVAVKDEKTVCQSCRSFFLFLLALLKLPVDFRSNQHSGKINNEL